MRSVPTMPVNAAERDGVLGRLPTRRSSRGRATAATGWWSGPMPRPSRARPSGRRAARPPGAPSSSSRRDAVGHPTVIDGRLEPAPCRPARVRVRGETVGLLPGGLTRVAFDGRAGRQLLTGRGREGHLGAGLNRAGAACSSPLMSPGLPPAALRPGMRWSGAGPCRPDADWAALRRRIDRSAAGPAAPRGTESRRVGGRRPRRGAATPGAGDDARLLYFHGGGYAVGSPRSHRSPVAGWRRVRRPGLAVDYRLAPEHPHPAALQDARAVWGAACGRRAPRRIAVAGDSAGGGLALALALSLGADGGPLPGGGRPDLALAGPRRRHRAAGAPPRAMSCSSSGSYAPSRGPSWTAPSGRRSARLAAYTPSPACPRSSSTPPTTSRSGPTAGAGRRARARPGSR